MENEKREMREVPEVEREEIRLIYMKKGFRGRQLEGIVKKICSDDKMWLETMMTEELGLIESKDINPLFILTIGRQRFLTGNPFLILKIWERSNDTISQMKFLCLLKGKHCFSR